MSDDFQKIFALIQELEKLNQDDLNDIPRKQRDKLIEMITNLTGTSSFYRGFKGALDLLRGNDPISSQTIFNMRNVDVLKSFAEQLQQSEKISAEEFERLNKQISELKQVIPNNGADEIQLDENEQVVVKVILQLWDQGMDPIQPENIAEKCEGLSKEQIGETVQWLNENGLIKAQLAIGNGYTGFQRLRVPYKFYFTFGVQYLECDPEKESQIVLQFIAREFAANVHELIPSERLVEEFDIAAPRIQAIVDWLVEREYVIKYRGSNANLNFSHVGITSSGKRKAR